MMSGKLYIDGYDVYKQYGVYVTDGGWNTLVAMPPLKDVEKNDWRMKTALKPTCQIPF